jgi:hypothetical protein
MVDSTNDLYFTDYNGGKVVGTHEYTSTGNGLVNISAKDIIIPERYLGVKVIEIGQGSFRSTSIESIFISRYIKTISYASLYDCRSLTYITFDENSELEYLGHHLIYYPKIESINLPASLKSVSSSDVFYYAPSLKCVSYFGSNDISFSNLFGTQIPTSVVAHSLPNYTYNIGKFTPVRDGQKCPEKIFYPPTKQISICACTCKCVLYTNTILTKTIVSVLLSL